VTNTVPSVYDPVTLFHWMWWKLLCYEVSPQEFQRLFEKVATRLGGDFVRIRPIGKLGDRKCDGLFWANGIVFQVYSPDELKLAKTLRKIEEDLAGAVKHWGDQLKRWVFVFNTRYGIAADIPQVLQKQNARYPNIKIEPLSSEMLWEQIREKLTLQQRAEILGPPSGYEHIFLPPTATSKEIEGLVNKGTIVVIHDVLSPVNVRNVLEAIGPEQPFGPPLYIHPPWQQGSWDAAAKHQQEAILSILKKSRDLLPKFALFSLAPIPLAIHLGYLFSDRVEVSPFQYDRERKSWVWDQLRKDYDAQFIIEGLPMGSIDNSAEVIVRVSLSARILPEDTNAVAGDCAVQVDLRVDNTNVMWLSRPEQLVDLQKVFRGMLSELTRAVPRCSQIHLFYAGPTGGAIVLGQAINPRMNPEIALYEYHRQKSPKYEHVLSLK
jgi:hypothetical protein